MYGKLVSVMYALNIIFDAFLTMLIPPGLCFGIAWLLVSFVGAPTWIYAPFLIVGVILGLISMVKFILTAMAGYERLEQQRAAARKQRISPNGSAESSSSRDNNECASPSDEP